MTDDTQADTAPVETDTAPAANASTSTSTDTTDGTSATEDSTRAPISPSDFAIPEAYKDKPWAQKIKTHDDVFKQLDNLHSLIGKKTITPIDYLTATVEEISEHHRSIAPENVSDYDFGENSDPAFSSAVGEVFQKFGINTHQAKGLATEINTIAAKMAEEKQEKNTDIKDYMKIMQESFGDDHEKIVGVIEKGLKEHVESDSDKAALDSMDNATRAVVDRTVYAFMTKYEARIAKILKDHGVTETSAQIGGGEGMNKGVDIEAQKKDIRQQIAKLESGIHTAEDKQVLKDKLHKIYVDALI